MAKQAVSHFPKERSKPAEAPKSKVQDQGKAPKRPRIALDFSPVGFARVHELMEIAGVDKTSDFFRDALRIYEWYIVRKSQGHTLLLEKDGKVTAVDLGL